MVIEIVVAVCIAFAAAGIALGAGKLFRRKLPVIGVLGVAAAAVIVSLAWIRYGWADRVRAAMPPELRVVREVKAKNVLEPWTFIAPRVTAVVAIDDSKTLRHPDHPGILIVALLHAERYEDTLALRVMVDCPRSRYAVLDGGADLSRALPPDAAWTTGTEADDLLAASCGSAENRATR